MSDNRRLTLDSSYERIGALVTVRASEEQLAVLRELERVAQGVADQRAKDNRRSNGQEQMPHLD